MNERTERKCTHSFFQKIGDKNCMPCIQYEKWGYSAGARWCLGRDYRCRESCYASPISTPKVGPRDQNSKLKRSWGKSWVSSRKKGPKKVSYFGSICLVYFICLLVILPLSDRVPPVIHQVMIYGQPTTTYRIPLHTDTTYCPQNTDNYILVIALWWYTIPLKRPKFGR